MSFLPNNAFAPFLPTTVVLPENEEALRVRLTSFFNEIALKVNTREIASYEFVENLTGQTWFSTNPNQKRIPFRKVISISSLTGGGTTSVPHGIGNISGFTFTRIFGCAKNSAGTLFIPLPQAAPDDVSITVDANNVNITCATGTYNGFSANIVLEYLKN